MTDEQIFDIAEPFGSFEYGDAQGHKRLGFARAIEAAATAPLMERIAELEQRAELAEQAHVCAATPCARWSTQASCRRSM